MATGPARPLLNHVDNTLTLRFAVMGGEGELLLAGHDPATREAAAAAAVQEARRIEARYSRYRPDSIVSQVNAAAGSGRALAVDGETAALLDFAARLHADSGGRFDITSGILRQAWDFKRAELPCPQLLEALCRRIGWARVQWDGQALALPEPGMEIDFGGIGKEYAADRCAGLLLDRGLRHGWINLGGDIRVIGPQLDGRPWRMGIRHPRQADATVASVAMRKGALATSGDYERFVEIDGQRHCHILDPRTGSPVRHWQSVSVQAPVCVAAGALSTVAMLMGPQAPAWLQEQGVAWLAVDGDGRLHHERMDHEPQPAHDHRATRPGSGGLLREQ